MNDGPSSQTAVGAAAGARGAGGAAMSADASGRVRLPDKRAALKMIADYTAGMISAGTWEEITGLLPSGRTG